MPLPSSINVLGHQEFLEMMKNKLAECNHLCISGRYYLFAIMTVCRAAEKVSSPITSVYWYKKALVLTLERQYYWLDQVGTINIAK